MMGRPDPANVCRVFVTAVLASGAVIGSVAASAKTAVPSNSSGTLSDAAQSLFDYSMQVQDLRWDDYYKYILYQEGPGEFSTRFTAWYAAGLLHRAEGNDVENARAALENVLKSQMTSDYDSAWYGTYRVALDEPEPTDGSTYWPPEIYDTYDPNWREFIGTQLVQIVELYSHLLGDVLVGRIEDALEMGAVGEMRRNGSYPEGDNLVLSYSNPALMRCLTVGWIGARRGNATLIDFADEQGAALLELFRADGADTFGEYNAPTYYGMDIWALAANVAYGPANATMTTNARYMLTALWRDIADHYNPYLRNLVGPYDRAYTRDMTAHSAVLSLWWWALFGRQYGGQPPLGESDLLYDVSQGAAVALLADTALACCIDNDTAIALTTTGKWAGSRLLNRTIRSSLSEDAEVRTVTSWLSAEVMIGAQSLVEDENRGEQFVPAIVHWASDPNRATATAKSHPYVGFFSLYPSASTIEAIAGPGSLRVRYPNVTQDGTDIFTFAVSGIPPAWTLGGRRIGGLEELPCLSINVSAPGLEELPVTASTSALEDHYYYNVSYAIPDGFNGTPEISLKVDYIC